MRAYLLSTLVVACALAAAGTVTAQEGGEEKLAKDKLPQAVAEAAKKRFPDAEVSGASKETENGKTHYEVSLRHKGKNIDATFTEDGVLVTIEQELSMEDLPAPVRDGLKAKFPGATYKNIESVTKAKDGKEALEYFETLLVTAEKKELEVEVGEDGTIKKATDKSGKKD